MLTPVILALSALVQAAPQDPQPSHGRRTAFVMGTRLEIDVEAADRPIALAASEAALRAVEAVEERLSTWRSDTELARLNAAPSGEAQRISAALASDLERASHWWAETEGAFDPGIGCLVAAWDLRGGGRLPNDDVIAACLEAGGLRSFQLNGRAATRMHAGLIIEEGGFGKGVALDAALAALAKHDVRAATLDLGGQVAVLGQKKTFGLAHPTDRERQVLQYTLEDGSSATSGNSERGITVSGEKLGHLLDPHTGRPVRDFGSLTVFAKNATDADCLSTGLYVLGAERALEWAATREGIEVLVLEISDEGRLRARATKGLEGRITPIDGLEIEWKKDRRDS